jgi:hypothetical protein
MIDTPAAIKNTQNRYRPGAHLECNDRPAFKTHETQPRPQILASDPTSRHRTQAHARSFDSFDVSERPTSAISLGNVVKKLVEVLLGLRRKDDLGSQAFRAPRPLLRRRIAPNTLLAGMARLGSAASAS